MGTAVLLPQDCLPTSRSRHNRNFSDVLYGSSFSDAIYGSSSSPRARGDTLQVLDPQSFYAVQSRLKFNKRVGWIPAPASLPVPDQGYTSAKVNSLQRTVHGKKAKVRRPVETRDAKLVSKPVLDVPVFTILQRPKDKEVAKELITKFLVKVDQATRSVGLPDVKVSESALRRGTQNAFLEAKNGVSNLKKRMFAPAVQGPKVQDSKSDVPKLQSLSTKVECATVKESKAGRGKNHGPVLPASVSKSSFNSRFDGLLSVKGLNQMLSLKVAEELNSLRTAGAAENFGSKLAFSNGSTGADNVVERGLSRLRRASTDPQIAKHLAGQCRSEVMEIPCRNARPFHCMTRSSSMSCPERWAGPAYSSSPAPSSLPLPKFSCLNQKISSPNFRPVPEEGSNMKLTQILEMGSVCASPGVPQGGQLDVASATRSLRRILKLEPL